MKELTARQSQILELIKHCVKTQGVPPTRAEIANTLGFRSANAAEDHLRALARKGYIEMTPGASRGIRLVKRVPKSQEGLPVLGRVAAGSPMLAEENVETRYSLIHEMFQPLADYMLKVRGMSMRDAGILEGDLIAIHRTQDVRNGQLVVARIDNEVTVKRYWKKGNKVTLEAENPDFQDIEVDLARQPLDIEGIVVGVVRNTAL